MGLHYRLLLLGIIAMPTLILQQVDRGFLRSLFWIALPIALQSMLFSSRSLVDILMLGQLGNAQVAAAGIAGKAFFYSQHI